MKKLLVLIGITVLTTTGALTFAAEPTTDSIQNKPKNTTNCEQHCNMKNSSTFKPKKSMMNSNSGHLQMQGQKLSMNDESEKMLNKKNKPQFDKKPSPSDNNKEMPDKKPPIINNNKRNERTVEKQNNMDDNDLRVFEKKRDIPNNEKKPLGKKGFINGKDSSISDKDSKSKNNIQNERLTLEKAKEQILNIIEE